MNSYFLTLPAKYSISSENKQTQTPYLSTAVREKQHQALSISFPWLSWQLAMHWVAENCSRLSHHTSTDQRPDVVRSSAGFCPLDGDAAALFWRGLAPFPPLPLVFTSPSLCLCVASSLPHRNRYPWPKDHSNSRMNASPWFSYNSNLPFPNTVMLTDSRDLNTVFFLSELPLTGQESRFHGQHGWMSVLLLQLWWLTTLGSPHEKFLGMWKFWLKVSRPQHRGGRILSKSEWLVSPWQNRASVTDILTPEVQELRLTLLCVCHLRCEFSAVLATTPATCYHADILLSWTLTLWNHKLKETLLEDILVMAFYHSHNRVTTITDLFYYWEVYPELSSHLYY